MKVPLLAACALFLLASAASTRSMDAAALTPRHRLKLLTPAGYLSGVPLLVRVEVLNSAGARERDLWDAQAQLSLDTGAVLSTNLVRLRNGLGSVLLTVNGTGNILLSAQVGPLLGTRPLSDRSGETVKLAGGTLSGATIWSGIVRVTNDVTIPTGGTLSIQPNTLVMIDGVASGSSANDLLVSGAVNSLGTEDQPISITCSSPTLRWGQIRHDNAAASVYRHTTISQAGRGTGEGHTGTTPVIRVNNSKIRFESSNLANFAEGNRAATGFGGPGKVMMAMGSDLVFDNCLLTRARMGPEIEGTALLCTNTWIMEMPGPDDADGFYAHDQKAGEQVLFTGCVMADGDDDGIDTLGAVVDVENCIIRDWANRGEDAKGISIFNGATHVKHSLIVNSTVGIGAKWSSGSTTLITIDNCTLTDNLTNVWANKKSNAPGPFIDFRITNSVLWGGQSVVSDFAPTNFNIGYSDISQPWTGTGNLNADPKFVNAAARDYHLLPQSPAIDSGSPASPLDFDGSRADLGVFVFIPPGPQLGISRGAPAGLTLSAYPGRIYTIESSPDLFNWKKLTGFYLTNSSASAADNEVAPRKFYRARLGP